MKQRLLPPGQGLCGCWVGAIMFDLKATWNAEWLFRLRWLWPWSNLKKSENVCATQTVIHQTLVMYLQKKVRFGTLCLLSEHSSIITWFKVENNQRLWLKYNQNVDILFFNASKAAQFVAQWQCHVSLLLAVKSRNLSSCWRNYVIFCGLL